MKTLWDGKNNGASLNSQKICSYIDGNKDKNLFVGTSSSSAWINFINAFKSPYASLKCNSKNRDETFYSYGRVVYYN